MNTDSPFPHSEGVFEIVAIQEKTRIGITGVSRQAAVKEETAVVPGFDLDSSSTPFPPPNTGQPHLAKHPSRQIADAKAEKAGPARGKCDLRTVLRQKPIAAPNGQQCRSLKRIATIGDLIDPSQVAFHGMQGK